MTTHKSLPSVLCTATGKESKGKWFLSKRIVSKRQEETQTTTHQNCEKNIRLITALVMRWFVHNWYLASTCSDTVRRRSPCAVGLGRNKNHDIYAAWCMLILYPTVPYFFRHDLPIPGVHVSCCITIIWVSSRLNTFATVTIHKCRQIVCKNCTVSVSETFM